MNFAIFSFCNNEADLLIAEGLLPIQLLVTAVAIAMLLQMQHGIRSLIRTGTTVLQQKQEVKDMKTTAKLRVHIKYNKLILFEANYMCELFAIAQLL